VNKAAQTNLAMIKLVASRLESISGHLLPDAASQARASLIKGKIEEIILMGS